MGPGQPRLWSPDFALEFSIESPDSRVWASQGPRNVSWDPCFYSSMIRLFQGKYQMVQIGYKLLENQMNF